jgi:uncharacterized membrane protein
MKTEQTKQSTESQSYDGKTIALISYLTLIGWVIAFVLHGNNKTSLGVFHLRQSAFLMLAGIGIYAVQFFLFFIPYIGWTVSVLAGIMGLGIIVLWILGLIAAINGEEKPLPIFGMKIQKMLSGLS